MIESRCRSRARLRRPAPDGLHLLRLTNLRFQGATLAHVLRHARESRDGSVRRANRERAIADPSDLPVGSHDAVLLVVGAVDLPGDGVADALSIVGVHGVQPAAWRRVEAVDARPPDQLVPRADVEQRPGGELGQPEHLPDRLGELLEPRVAGGQLDPRRADGLLVPLALGDVEAHADRAEQLAAGRQSGLGHAGDPAPLRVARAPYPAHLAGERQALGQRFRNAAMYAGRSSGGRASSISALPRPPGSPRSTRSTGGSTNWLPPCASVTQMSAGASQPSGGIAPRIELGLPRAPLLRMSSARTRRARRRRPPTRAGTHAPNTRSAHPPRPAALLGQRLPA